jgi:hypothetical protein
MVFCAGLIRCLPEIFKIWYLLTDVCSVISSKYIFQRKLLCNSLQKRTEIGFAYYAQADIYLNYDHIFFFCHAWAFYSAALFMISIIDMDVEEGYRKTRLLINIL